MVIGGASWTVGRRTFHEGVTLLAQWRARLARALRCVMGAEARPAAAVPGVPEVRPARDGQRVDGVNRRGWLKLLPAAPLAPLAAKAAAPAQKAADYVYLNGKPYAIKSRDLTARTITTWENITESNANVVISKQAYVAFQLEG